MNDITIKENPLDDGRPVREGFISVTTTMPKAKFEKFRDRYTATQRMGVTGDELTVLHEFATTYRDFWLRQTVASYEAACDALSKARATNTTEVEIRP